MLIVTYVRNIFNILLENNCKIQYIPAFSTYPDPFSSIGWRGYAQEPLQQKFGVFGGSALAFGKGASARLLVVGWTYLSVGP